MQKWEYLEIIRDQDARSKEDEFIVQYLNGQNISKQRIPFNSYMNKLGEEGWELVSSSASGHSFKRPKP